MRQDDPDFWDAVATVHRQNALRWAHDAEQARARNDMRRYQRSIASARNEQRLAALAELEAG